MHGNAIGYTMYYNEVLIPDHDDDDDDDWDEIEEEYYIEGIMIVDGAEYPIRGERSSESEPGESEEETEFIVTLSSTRRMVVEQSVETEDGEHEREYNYVIYEGRNVIERSTFEYEVEYGETEARQRSHPHPRRQHRKPHRELYRQPRGKRGRHDLLHLRAHRQMTACDAHISPLRQDPLKMSGSRLFARMRTLFVCFCCFILPF